MTDDDIEILTPEQHLDAQVKALAESYRAVLSPHEVVDYINILIDAGSRGATDDQLAAALGVSRTVMNSFAADHIDFLNALMFARTLARSWWSLAMREAAVAPNAIDYKVVYRMYDSLMSRGDDGNPVQTKPEPATAPAGSSEEDDGTAADAGPIVGMSPTQAESEIARLIEQEVRRNKWVQ